jgi:hypothetical protein
VKACKNRIVQSRAGFNHIIHTVRDLPQPWCGPCSRGRRLTSALEQAFCWHIARCVSGMNLQLPPDSNDQALKSPSARPRPPHARPNCLLWRRSSSAALRPSDLNFTSLHHHQTSHPSRTRLAARKRCHERRRPVARVLACLLDHHPAAKKRRHRLSHADRQRPGQPVSCMSSPSSTAPTTLCYSCHHSHYRSYYTRPPVLSR